MIEFEIECVKVKNPKWRWWKFWIRSYRYEFPEMSKLVDMIKPEELHHLPPMTPLGQNSDNQDVYDVHNREGFSDIERKIFTLIRQAWYSGVLCKNPNDDQRVNIDLAVPFSIIMDTLNQEATKAAIASLEKVLPHIGKKVPQEQMYNLNESDQLVMRAMNIQGNHIKDVIESEINRLKGEL